MSSKSDKVRKGLLHGTKYVSNMSKLANDTKIVQNPDNHVHLHSGKIRGNVLVAKCRKQVVFRGCLAESTPF